MADNVLEAKISALRDLVATQFAEREKLHDSAQNALTKQIDALNETNMAASKSLEMRLDRLTDRITVIESTSAGTSHTWGLVIVLVGLIFSGMVAFGIYAAR